MEWPAGTRPNQYASGCIGLGLSLLLVPCCYIPSFGKEGGFLKLFLAFISRPANSFAFQHSAKKNVYLSTDLWIKVRRVVQSSWSDHVHAIAHTRLRKCNIYCLRHTFWLTSDRCLARERFSRTDVMAQIATCPPAFRRRRLVWPMAEPRPA